MGNSNTPVTIELIARAGDEPCNVDIVTLNDTLLKLPAEKYLELYRTMTWTLAKYNPPRT